MLFLLVAWLLHYSESGLTISIDMYHSFFQSINSLVFLMTCDDGDSYKSRFWWINCVLHEPALFYVFQGAIMTTSTAAASHSVILTTFSGNSSAAEIRLQTFSVGLWWDLTFSRRRKKEGLKRVLRVQSRQRLLLAASFYLVKNTPRWPETENILSVRVVCCVKTLWFLISWQRLLCRKVIDGALDRGNVL